MIGTISLILIFMWILFIFSIETENDVFLFLSSAGLILVSIYIMVNGLEGVNNFVTQGLATIQIGFGFIGIFSHWYSIWRMDSD